VAGALRTSQANLVYGDVRVLGANTMVADGARYGGPFTLARLMGQNICQQAVFYRRSVFARVGLFDLQYLIWADWDFAQRAFVTEPTQWLDVVVSDYSASGMSSHQQDDAFVASRRQRLWRLWRARPLSLAVPAAVLRNGYWNFRKARAA
jgi:hypothetical protein